MRSISNCLLFTRLPSLDNVPDLLKKHSYLFDMGYPYYISSRDNVVAFTTDFGLCIIRIWMSEQASSKQSHDKAPHFKFSWRTSISLILIFFPSNLYLFTVFAFNSYQTLQIKCKLLKIDNVYERIPSFLQEEPPLSALHCFGGLTF